LALGTAAFAVAFYSWRPPVMARWAFNAALAGICIVMWCIIPCAVTNLCYRRLFRPLLADAPYATQDVEGRPNLLAGVVPTPPLVSAAGGGFTLSAILLFFLMVTGTFGP